MTDLPDWAVWLDVPLAKDGELVRHRVLHGGRGGAKSWTIAQKLVERAIRSSERILCAREYQNSIRDSSKKLLEDIINRMSFGPSGNRFFTFTENEIRGCNGSVFSFLGLNGRDASIKSFEGYSLAWVEEAATVSKASIDALIPTIRREGSEIWWSYNPRFASDPVDLMFRGSGGPPPGSIVLEVHWRDNPWFPDVLRRDMEYDLSRDADKHAHVWQGAYVQHSEAKVFSNWSVMPFGLLRMQWCGWGPTGDTAKTRPFSSAAFSAAGQAHPEQVRSSLIRKGERCSLTTKLTWLAARSTRRRRCSPAPTPGSRRAG